MPAETPAGLAYRLRERGSQLSQSMCWEVTGRSNAKENMEPTAYHNLIDVEYRFASPVPFHLFPAKLLHGRHACTALLCNWKVPDHEEGSVERVASPDLHHSAVERTCKFFM